MEMITHRGERSDGEEGKNEMKLDKEEWIYGLMTCWGRNQVGDKGLVDERGIKKGGLSVLWGIFLD